MLFLPPIILLLFSILSQCLTSEIGIWVKPDNMQYTAKILCLQNHRWKIIGEKEHNSNFPPASGEAQECEIITDFGICDRDEPNATILIKKMDSDETAHFVFSKAELSARRKVVVVLSFNIRPVTTKMFHIIRRKQQQPFLGNHSIGAGVVIYCSYYDEVSSNSFKYAIGAGVQHSGQNVIRVPMYDIATAFCMAGRIFFNVLHNGERSFNHEIQREEFLMHSEFKINIENENIRPITVAQSTANASAESDPSNGSASVNTLATSNVRDHPSSASLTAPPTVHFQELPCVFCANNKRKFAFVPCGHYCACEKCADNTIEKGGKCPICSGQIDSKLQIRIA